MSKTFLSKAVIAAAFVCVAGAAQAQVHSVRDVAAPAGKRLVNEKGETVQCKTFRLTASLIRRTGCGTSAEWREAGLK
jgi:hypothetical protein